MNLQKKYFRLLFYCSIRYSLKGTYYVPPVRVPTSRITTTMKRDDGRVIHIKKSTRQEPVHIRIYDALHLPHRPGRTIKTIL